MSFFNAARRARNSGDCTRGWHKARGYPPLVPAAVRTTEGESLQEVPNEAPARVEKVDARKGHQKERIQGLARRHWRPKGLTFKMTKARRAWNCSLGQGSSKLCFGRAMTSIPSWLEFTVLRTCLQSSAMVCFQSRALASAVAWKACSGSLGQGSSKPCL